MICQICGYETSTKGISRHLTFAHGISNKDYYDMYSKQENEGICPICGKETQFYSLTKGYNKHCSTTCSSRDPNVQEKLRKTNQSLYGVDVGFQTQQCIDNSHSKTAIDKKNQTMLKRYNVLTFISTDNVRQKITNTLLDRYNVSNSYQIPQIREKAIISANTEQSIQKRHNTRKVNGWNSNKVENFVKEFLYINKFDFEYNWKSNLYPWKVDFYIRDLNLFLELNLFWTHNFHWFDPTNSQDMQTLSNWQQKNNEYYDNAIKIWTIRDIQKRDFAIENNLNYVVVWNKTQLSQFLTDLLRHKKFIGFIDYNRGTINNA